MLSAKSKKLGNVAIIHILLFIWLVISLMPPIMLLAASLNANALFRSPLDLLLLKDFSLANYTAAFEKQKRHKILEDVYTLRSSTWVMVQPQP